MTKKIKVTGVGVISSGKKDPWVDADGRVPASLDDRVKGSFNVRLDQDANGNKQATEQTLALFKGSDVKGVIYDRTDG